MQHSPNNNNQSNNQQQGTKKARKVLTSTSSSPNNPHAHSNAHPNTHHTKPQLPQPHSSRIILMKSSIMLNNKHYRLQSYIEGSTYILSARSLRNGQEYHQLITMPSRHYQELYRIKLGQNHQNIGKELVVDQEQGLLQVKGFRSQFRDIYDYGEVIVDTRKVQDKQTNKQQKRQVRQRSRSKDIIVHFSSYQNGDDISDRITYTQSQYDQHKLQPRTFEQVPITLENNNNNNNNNNNTKNNNNERVNKIKSRNNNNSRTSENVIRGGESKKASRNQGSRNQNNNNKNKDKQMQRNSIINQYQVVVESPTQSRILKGIGVSKRENKMSTNIINVKIQPQHKQPGHKQPVHSHRSIISHPQPIQNRIAQSHSQPIGSQATNFNIQQLKQIPQSQLSEEVSEQVITKELRNKKSNTQQQQQKKEGHKQKQKQKQITNEADKKEEEEEQPKYEDEQFQIEEYEQKIKQKQKSINMNKNKNKNMKKQYNPYKQEQYQDIQVIDDHA